MRNEKKAKKITNPLMVVWLFCQSLAVGHLLREREKQVQVASFNFKMFFFKEKRNGASVSDGSRATSDGRPAPKTWINLKGETPLSKAAATRLGWWW